eukprot:572023-Amphidinium_carterae.1
MVAFAQLQALLTQASVLLREAQQQEQSCAATVSRLRAEIAEASPGDPPTSPAPSAVADSFLAAAPSVAALDTPTQELLRLAIAHGYNAAAHCAAAPALNPADLTAPAASLVSALVQSPPLPPPSAQGSSTMPVPASTALDSLQSQQASEMVHANVSQMAVFASRIEAAQLQAATAVPPPPTLRHKMPLLEQ